MHYFSDITIPRFQAQEDDSIDIHFVIVIHGTIFCSFGPTSVLSLVQDTSPFSSSGLWIQPIPDVNFYGCWSVADCYPVIMVKD